MIVSLIFRRLIGLIATLVLTSGIVFAAIEILPGDPAEVMLGTDARPDTLRALRHEMGLDQPLMSRYRNWAFGMATGDFGVSHTYATPVRELVADRLVVSAPLAIAALLLTVTIALPLGAYAATRRGTFGDGAVMFFTQVGLALPNFWLALLLVFVFAISLHWLPSGGFPGWTQGWAAVKALILPAVALAIPQAAILARIMRTSLLETLDETYMRAARAKGLSARSTVVRHALRNALIPVLTVMGLQFSFLIAGTIIIENVFSLPGLGRLIFQAINQRDLVVVESVAMILIAGVIVTTFIVDLAYLAVDPRLRRRA